MTTTNMTAPTLLRHLIRTLDVRLSIEGAEFVVENAELVVEGADSRRAAQMIQGRAVELIRLLKSRASWLEDIGLRGRA